MFDKSLQSKELTSTHNAGICQSNDADWLGRRMNEDSSLKSHCVSIGNMTPRQHTPPEHPAAAADHPSYKTCTDIFQRKQKQI